MAKNWAVCIGINHYVNMPELYFAKRDAERMRDWFTANNFEKVYLFTDDSPPIDDGSKPSISRPTFATLKRFLRVRFRPKTLNVEDNLWFFFSGHGTSYRGNDYLMPSDGDPHPEGVEETAISLDYVTEQLVGCGAGDVVIVFDACRDQVSDKGAVGEKEQKGVFTLSSCSPNQKSYEVKHPEIQQGASTYALIESLENMQLGRENYATFDRLYQRLRYRVPEINRQYNNPDKQTPYGYVKPDEKRNSILFPKWATTQDIESYKKQALNAEIDGNLHEAERLLVRLWEICPGDSEVRQYYNRVILKKAQQLQGKPAPLPSPPPTLSATAKGQEVEQKQEQLESLLIPNSIFLSSRTALETLGILVNRHEVKQKQERLESFTENLGKGVTLEIVAIPAGSFMMGAPENEKDSQDRELPQHRVSVPAFLMGKYPVTQAQWRAVAGFPQVQQALDPDPSSFKGDNRPVEQVSWLEAVEFCARLSNHTKRKYRLSSEAEWEYACRAGTTTAYSFGNDVAQLENHAWYDKNSGGKTHPVGQKPSNAFGLYDMHGNVWEWCDDDWHENYEGAPTDGRARIYNNDNRYQGDKLLRGGSWIDDARHCRSACRYGNVARFQYCSYGFRVVCRLQ